MRSHTRRAALAVLLIATLVAVLSVHAQDYNLDGSQLSFSGMAFNNDRFVFSHIPYVAEGLTISITNGQVSGSGLTFQGLGAADADNSRPIAVIVSAMTVTTSTITLANSFPRNGDVRFISTSGAALTGPLFTLSSLSLVHNSSLVITNPSATWTAAAGQSMISATGAVTVNDISAFFVEQASTSSAINSIYSSTGTSQVASKSVFAIDYASCTSCAGALVNPGTVQVTDQSLYRVSSATAGSGGILTGTFDVSVVSVLETSGSVPTGAQYIPGLAASTVDAASRVTLGPFTGGASLGATMNISPGQAYVSGASTAGGAYLDTVTKWETAGVTGNVNVFDANGQTGGTCANTHCLNGAQVTTSGTTCSCDCGTDLYVPYCTAMYDPIEVSSVCPPLPLHCVGLDPVTCVCTGCDDEYDLLNGACVPRTTPSPNCNVPNCKSCCKVDTSTCCECDIGYVLNPDTRLECVLCSVRIPGCGGCIDWYTCGTCSTAYQVSGSTCVRRPTANGASVVVRPTVVGVLLLLISSLAIYVG